MQNTIEYEAFADSDSTENEPRKPFEIQDDGAAEWAMRRIADAREDTAKWEAHFAEQMASIRKANEQTEAFFTAALARYFEKCPLHVTKTQAKYSLPCGDLLRKVQAPKFTLDDDLLVPFLQKNALSEYVKTKASADWASLKKACAVMPNGSVVETNTGMVLPGVTAEMRPEKFEVKING